MPLSCSGSCLRATCTQHCWGSGLTEGGHNSQSPKSRSEPRSNLVPKLLDRELQPESKGTPRKAMSTCRLGAPGLSCFQAPAQEDYYGVPGPKAAAVLAILKRTFGAWLQTAEEVHGKVGQALLYSVNSGPALLIGYTLFWQCGWKSEGLTQKEQRGAKATVLKVLCIGQGPKASPRSLTPAK